MADKTLRELVYGKGAHVDPVACIEDISAALATRAVEGYPHSIWQIVEHMNYWMEYDLRKMAGEDPRYPDHAIESWSAHPNPASDELWHAVASRFGQLLTRMATLAESDSGTLERVVRELGSPEAARESTVGVMLWKLVAHNSYHLGQIALLRRQMGAWPPRRGGDTW